MMPSAVGIVCVQTSVKFEDWDLSIAVRSCVPHNAPPFVVMKIEIQPLSYVFPCTSRPLYCRSIEPNCANVICKGVC